MSQKKVLILGASSFVGLNLFSRLGAQRATGTYCKRPVEQGVYFDALKTPLADIVKRPQDFSHAVILLGDTSPDSCAKNIKQSRHLNVTRIQEIIDQLKAFKIIPVFTSTEVVFDGEKGNYVETDSVNPLLAYGLQKVEIEQYLKNFCGKFIIARLGRVFGSKPEDGTIFTSWLKQLDGGLTIRCAGDHIFSPLHVDEVGNGLIRLMEEDCKGIYHLSGRQALSRIDMLKLLTKYYRRLRQAKSEIVECSLHDFDVPERRPLNVSMIPEKIINDTGLKIEPLDTWCSRIVTDWFKNHD